MVDSSDKLRVAVCAKGRFARLADVVAFTDINGPQIMPNHVIKELCLQKLKELQFANPSNVSNLFAEFVKSKPEIPQSMH